MGADVCKQIDVHWFPLPFLHVWNPWKFMECILEIGNPNSMEFTDLEPETGIWIPMKSMEFMTSMEFHWNSMEFHWIVWTSMAFHSIPWNTMGFFGIPWSSIACHDIFWITFGYSWMQFHDGIHGISLNSWNSMNFIVDSMEFHGFHGIPWNPWNSMGQARKKSKKRFGLGRTGLYAWSGQASPDQVLWICAN